MRHGDVFWLDEGTVMVYKSTSFGPTELLFMSVELFGMLREYKGFLTEV